MKLVFLGPPGAGKGTQARMVAEDCGIPHISTGEMFREAIGAETPTGRRAKVFIDQGKLVPDDVVIDMVKERLSMKDAASGYLLDGFPRTVLQAEALESYSPVDGVVNIDVDDEELVKRLSGRRVCKSCGVANHVSALRESKCPECEGEVFQRDDDRIETIKSRLSVYHSQTAPLKEYYRAKGKLYTVNGALLKQSVREEISSVLERIL